MAQAKPTETAEITVAYVNPPKAGKKWGNVKDTAGTCYFGPPGMLNQFQPGETCKIEFELGGNDGTLRSLKHKVSTTPAALVRQATPIPRAPTNPRDGERMGTMGMVNAFIHSGGVELHRDAIKAAINVCREAYNDVWGTPQKQKTEQEFSDEIPY